MILTDNDLNEIGRLRSSIVEALLNGNADNIAALCTDDVCLLHPDTGLIKGRKEVRDHEAEIINTARVSKLELLPVEIYGTTHLAYEVGTQNVEIDPPDERFRGKRKYVHILKKDDHGRWRFSVLISNNSS